MPRCWKLVMLAAAKAGAVAVASPVGVDQDDGHRHDECGDRGEPPPSQDPPAPGPDDVPEGFLMSESGPDAPARARSGDIYCAEPTMTPDRVTVPSPSKVASPKSV